MSKIEKEINQRNRAIAPGTEALWLDELMIPSEADFDACFMTICDITHVIQKISRGHIDPCRLRRALDDLGFQSRQMITPSRQEQRELYTLKPRQHSKFYQGLRGVALNYQEKVNLISDREDGVIIVS